MSLHSSPSGTIVRTACSPPMLDASAIAAGFGQLAPESLRAAVENFLPKGATTDQKIAAIEAGLKSPAGQAMRETMARWIVDEIVPVGTLVPEGYAQWRLPVRDAMMFVVARLSPARLAPKLLEQIELPAEHISRGATASSHFKGTRPTETGPGHCAQPALGASIAKGAGQAGKRNSRCPAGGHPRHY